MINRYLDLKKLLKQNTSSFLFGPRGVGKTLLCKNFLKQLPHSLEINLLNHDLYTRYLVQPGLIRKEIEAKISDNKTLTVFIDEVQKLPSILDEVHYLLEQYKGRVRFLLTGSSARKLKRGGANLLAGRAWTLKLHPLSFLEMKIDLNRVIKYGSLPSIYFEDNEPERSLKAYVETYLKEEIMQEALVRNIEGYIKFLDLAGQMNGEPVNFTKIARECNVSTKTVQEYFSILVDTLIAFRLEGWSFSVRKQLRQNPKFYFFDCGILNAIRGDLKTEIKESSYYYGKLFETYVIQEIIRVNDYVNADYRFNYWRTNTGLEVDLIISRSKSETPIAIEIKSKTAVSDIDLHALKSFKSENPKALLYCFSNSPNMYNLGDIKVFPWQEGINEVFGIK